MDDGVELKAQTDFLSKNLSEQFQDAIEQQPESTTEQRVENVQRPSTTGISISEDRRNIPDASPRVRYLNVTTIPFSEEDFSSSSQTTSTDTSSFTTSSGIMSNGERIPRLSAGPYHQRLPPPPVLPEEHSVDDFLNIQPPVAEMRGPPPHWNPPLPPLSDQDAPLNSRLEESQYEEPQMPLDTTHSESVFIGRPSISNRLPLAVNNNYPMSNNQQMRTAARSRNTRPETSGVASPWDDETRQMLVQNPETGSFYVPTGSGHTTMSSLSPLSRHYEKSYAPMAVGSSLGATCNMRAARYGTGIGEDLAHQATYAPNRGLSDAPDGPVGKLKRRLALWCNWRTFAIISLILLTSSLLALFFLAFNCGCSRTRSHYLPSYALSSTSGSRIFNNDTIFPKSFELGEIVDGDLAPKSLTFTKFALQRNSRVIFNVSVGQKARLVIYLKHTLLPSPTEHDFAEIIQGNHLLPEASSSSRSGLDSLFRLAIFGHFLEAGEWNILFLNDSPEPEHIRLYAGVSASVVDPKDRIYGCKDGCSGKGECKNEKCHCFPGFTGQYCDRTYCPVLCSGNGIYSGGQCVCYDGYKGKECDIPVQQCFQPCIHGICSQKGICECDHGWAGEACDEKNCVDPTCSGHGICEKGECYCKFGFKGLQCEEAFTLKSLCEASEGGIDNSKGTITSASLEADMACNSRGTVMNGTNVCRCIPGYHGDKCQLAVCDVKCMHGICGDGSCVCDAGWTGVACEEMLCLPGCEDHGVCLNGTCKCQQGWNGENCQISGCSENCNGKGDCRLLSNVWTCVCSSSHFGPDCSLPVESNCNDNIDNDGDGLTDCEDSECCTDISCASTQSCMTVKQPSAVLLRYPTSSNPTFFDKIKFLIDPDSVHLYADAKNFNESTASVIRGRVVSERGSPLTGVRISEAPHMGFTISRSEDNGGAFDLVVNGGRVVTLSFLRRGVAKLERSFYVPWNEIVYVGDVKMHVTSLLSASSEVEPLKDECRRFFAAHRVSPALFSSWQLSQYSGRLSSRTDSSQLLIDSRKIFDSVQIPGTRDIYLVYDSSRADNYSSTLLIKLLPERVDPSLRLVHLKIEIAGTYHETIFAAKPNLTYTFSWDQINVYGQTISGLANAQVSVGYEYAGCTGENIVWVHRTAKLEGKKAKRWSLGGWTLNIHHHYDYINNVLEKGDGSIVYLDESSQVLHTYVGKGEPRKENCLFCDNRRASAHLRRPMGLGFGSNGSLYIGDDSCIRKLLPDGSIMTVLELSASDVVHSYYMAVDPISDSLFVSIPLRRQIWQVTENKNSDITSNYKVVVGDGSKCTDTKLKCGDGGQAELAQLTFPKGIAFDTDGSLYIADSRRIRVVRPAKYAKDERVISTLIPSHGFGSRKCVGDFEDLAEVILEWPTSLAVDRFSKDLLVLDSDLIYRASVVSGTAQLIAGKLPECDEVRGRNGDILALRSLSHATSIAISKDSTVFVAETDGKKLNQIRALSADGNIRTVVGRLGRCDCKTRDCPCDDLKPTISTFAFLHYPSAIAFDPNDVLYIADEKNFKVKRLQRSRAAWNEHTNQYEIQNSNGNEAYVFNRNGVHIGTRTLFTDQWLYNFSYNVEISTGRLDKIASAGGTELKLWLQDETEKSREQMHLQASNGLRTTVFFDSFDKNLESIALPNSETIEFSYLVGQLLRSKYVKSRAWFYSYDQFGRGESLIDPAGNVISVGEQRVESRKLVTTALVNEKHYSTVYFSDSEFTEFGMGKTQAILLDTGFVIDRDGYRTHLDGVSMSRLDPHERLIMKRKITVPELSAPERLELNTRFEWREIVRERTGSDKRYWQVNGRNVVAIDYTTNKRIDVIQNGVYEDLLRLEYNEAGQLLRISPVSNFSLAEFRTNYDASGRQRKIVWGNITAENVYGLQNQLKQSGFSSNAINLTRKYAYLTDKHLLPSIVYMPSGEQYVWEYDDVGQVISFKTPSGNKNRFSKYISASHTILERQTAFSTSSFFASYDDTGHLLEYATPNGDHSLSVKRDLYGRLVKTTADSETVDYVYSDISDGSLLTEVSNNWLTRKYIHQGPLSVVVTEVYDAVRNPNSTFSKSMVEFSYEYDDLFRLSKIIAKFNQQTMEPLRFEYDLRDGTLIKANNLTFLSAGSITRIIGNNFMFESKRGFYGEEIERKIMVGNTKVAGMKIFRDSLGRIESVEWTVLKGRKATEKRTYDINGQLLHLTAAERDDRSWALHYDLDGRLKGLNDKKLDMNPAGIPMQFGDLKFVADANGWIIKRGDMSFEFDVYGRIRRAWQFPSLEVEYGYDEKSRLIWRKVNNQYLHRFFYANPNYPRLISHFISSDDAAVSMITYDEKGVPIILEKSRTRYGIMTDSDRSVRYIFSWDSNLVKEVIRDPLGRVVADSDPSLFFPLGFLSEFEDPLIELSIIGPEARPLDLHLGRFISTPVSFMKPSIDVFQPEYEADPFRLKRDFIIRTPLELGDWMELVGFSLSNIVPSLRTTADRLSVPLLDTNSLLSLCESGNPMILSSAICSLNKQTLHFSQFLTASSSGILPKFQSPAQPIPSLGSYSSNSTIGSKGIVFTKKREGIVRELNILSRTHAKALERLDSLLNHSNVVNTDDFGLLMKPGVVAQVHFATNLPDSYDITVFNELSSLFKVSLHKNSLVLNANKTQIVFHLHVSADQVRRILVNDLVQTIKTAIWANEISAIKTGQKTRHPWSQIQRKKLLSTGLLPDYDIKFQPDNSIPILSNKKLWRFEAL